MLKLKHVLKALLDWVPARPKADSVRKLTKVTKPIKLNVASFSEGRGKSRDSFVLIVYIILCTSHVQMRTFYESLR